MSHLRIAFLSEHASPLALLGGQDAGGQNVYVDEVSRGLGRLGIEVDVFTRRDNPALPEVVQWAPGVRVIHLRAGDERFIPKDDLWPLMPTFRQAFLAFAASNGRYDALHGNFWMSGWVAAQSRRILGAPVIQIFHAMGKTKRRHQGEADTSPAARIAIEHKIVRTVDTLIAQCPTDRAELVNEYGADSRKVTIIPSGVNVGRFTEVPHAEARRRIGLPQDGLVVAYVGRMLPRKDVRNVVRAMALLRKRWPDIPTPTLLLVGGETPEPDPVATPEIGKLMRLGDQLGVRDSMRFVGKQQPNTLHNFYSAADVIVTTPWYEPYGLTPLEAMACGRPVIGSAVGGISFTIKDGVTGYLVPPRDPDALAERLASMLKRPELRRRMGKAACLRIAREFTWPTVVERTATLYERVLSTHAPSHMSRASTHVAPFTELAEA
jgi:D-inositol-3-phosphate glycosyltransferase